MNKIVYIALVVAIVLLLVVGLLTGSVDIPASAVWHILMGEDESIDGSWRFIVLESRLPQLITAMLGGGCLATAGLMMQTVFRNPLAGPDVFGINGGAGLGVALVMLLFGGSVITVFGHITGSLAILAAAFLGASAVMAIILFCSTMVRNGVMLLVVGIMVGYLSSSAITLLNYSATEQGIRSFMLWGMGSLDGVTPSLLPQFVGVTLVALILSLLMVKPLNLLSLGENYARNLGLNTRTARNQVLLLAGFLTASVTAYCGPIAFIGLAVPHIARLITTTDDMRRLLPVTMLTGGAVTMLCHLLCFLPGGSGMLPLNAVTPLIGAPVIIYVILRKR